MFALAGARIFDGSRFLDRQAVVIGEDGRIAALVGEAELGAMVMRRVEGLLAPGFIDCQVNGGGGVLFNETRSIEGIRAIGRAHRRTGTTGFLPTFITDSRAHMEQAIAAVEAARAAGVPGLLGIHLEGPFLNPARKGVHDPRFMRPVEDEDLRLMTSLKAARTLVTLAPEQVPIEAIRRLAEAGVIVCAGHTEASYETIGTARAAGLAGFTHLFNAMPPLAGRAPGPVGAALADPQAWCGIIVDLVHVAAASLKVALAARGTERTFLVTDAMPAVGSDLTTFSLFGREVTRRDGKLTLADGTIAGADLDMASAVRNAVRTLGVPLDEALAMASRGPASFLGLSSELGRIAPGFRASLVLLDEDLRVSETWIDGVASGEAADQSGR
jgi:N-acetylglucosamine-6-phosphate deacetylase